MEAFQEYGANEVAIPVNEYGRPKGFGFVTIDDEHKENAIEAMNGQELKGRPIAVNEARPRTSSPRGDYGGGRGRRGGW